MTTPIAGHDAAALARCCPACGAGIGQVCRFRNSPDQQRFLPHRHRTKPPMVVFDIDGVLADMSPWDHELTRPGRGAFLRWQAFFSHIEEASLIAEGADLVHAVTHLGHPIRYSTTRPFWLAKRTLAWITAQGLPEGWVYSRRREHEPKPGSGKKGQPPAAHIKQLHAAEVDDYRGLAAFIDDETDAVTHLRGHGVNAHLASDLAQLTVKQLQARLTAPAAPRQQNPTFSAALSG